MQDKKMKRVTVFLLTFISYAIVVLALYLSIVNSMWYIFLSGLGAITAVIADKIEDDIHGR